MSSLPPQNDVVQQVPAGFTRNCSRCGQYVNPRAYVCPYCRNQLRTSPFTAMIAVFIGLSIIVTVIGSIGNAIFSDSTSGASILRAPAVSHLPVCIDAQSLLDKRPREVIPGLKGCGWDEVTYRRREGIIELHSKDGSTGIVVFDKDSLLFANFDIPHPVTVTPELVMAALHLPTLPAPTMAYASGMNWDGFPVPAGNLGGVTTNTTTHFSATYVTNERIRQWESEE